MPNFLGISFYLFGAINNYSSEFIMNSYKYSVVITFLIHRIWVIFLFENIYSHMKIILFYDECYGIKLSSFKL